MDCKNIIQQGEEAKFSMRIEDEDFDMETDEFSVELSWGMSGDNMTIRKSDMIHSVEGYSYFIFDTSGMAGRVLAKCIYDVPDTDCPDGTRTETDLQMICFVVSEPKARFACAQPPDTCEHKVIYERVDASGVISDDLYLVTSQDDRLITTDGEYILVKKETN